MHTFNDTDRKISGIGYADFGASYKGYKTDITVPFIKGKIGKSERKIVDTEMKAYRLAVKSLKLGEPCWKLFLKIYDFEKKEGFKLKHRLGHGLGRKIHEYPFIVIPGMESIKRAGKERKMFDWEVIRNHCFQSGMVFTIEPGIYVNGVGGCRLENDFLMSKNGPIQLTHSRLIELAYV
jgi:Xaa-Pro aminopeptidase